MFTTILILVLPQFLLLALYCLEHDDDPKRDGSNKPAK